MKSGKEIQALAGHVIGLDVGRSGVKIAFLDSAKNVSTKFFRSVIIPYRELTFDQNPKATEADTVEVNGNKYFVGETALAQGAKESIGLNANWLEGDEHTALLIRSQRYLKSYGVIPRFIVVGLPVNTFKHHAKILAQQVKEVFGHETIVLPVPQPYGVYQDEVLNDMGEFKGAKSISGQYAVIDIGHYSTDFLMMNENIWVEASSGSSDGMYVAVDNLNKILQAKGINLSPFKLQEVLMTKKIRQYGEEVDFSNEVREALQATVQLILQSTKRYIGSDASQMDKIIVAGGGAEVVFPSVYHMWKNAVKPENPRFSVALGMRKFGLKSLLEKEEFIAKVSGTKKA